jgi:hypothetical protein
MVTLQADAPKSEHLSTWCMTQLVLAPLSLVELAPHQSVSELIPDWCKSQSCGELKTRNFLSSSAKIKSLQWLIELHRSVMNALSRDGRRMEPCAAQDRTRVSIYENMEKVTEIIIIIDNTNNVLTNSHLQTTKYVCVCCSHSTDEDYGSLGCDAV